MLLFALVFIDSPRGEVLTKLYLFDQPKEGLLSELVGISEEEFVMVKWLSFSEVVCGSQFGFDEQMYS